MSDTAAMAVNRPKRPDQQNRRALVSVRVAPADADQLRAAAAERGITLSVLLAQALAAYVPGSLTEHVAQPVEDIAC